MLAAIEATWGGREATVRGHRDSRPQLAWASTFAAVIPPVVTTGAAPCGGGPPCR
jgi:hypothetical protein